MENKINVNLDEFVFTNPQPVLVCDMEGKIIFMNPATKDFAKNIGLKDEELKRLFPKNFDYKIKTLKKGEKVNQTGDIKQESFEGRLIFNYACFKNSKNIFVTFQDVTQQKKLEETIQESTTERKKNEEELRSANANLLNILESMEDGVYIVNQEYDIEFINPALKKEFGPPEGKKCHHYFHNRQDVCPWCKNQDVFAGKTVRWEWYSSRNQKTYDLIDTPITNTDGTISKLEIFRDITKRKSVEKHREQVLERQQKLNLVQKFLLGVESLEGKLKRVTEAIVETFSAHFCRIWMIKPGDLCNAGCIHGSSGSKEMPDECQYGKRCLHLMASAGRYTHIDGEHRRVSIGSYKIGPIAAGRINKFITNDVTHDPLIHNPEWAKKERLVSFAGYHLCDSAGKPIGVLALFAKHPISPEESANLEGISHTTAQVIQTEGAKEDLRKSEARMGSILKTVGEGIIAIDQDSTIFFINWEICSIFGYSEKELIGQKLQILMPEKYRARHTAGLKRYLEDGQSKILGRRFEIEGLRKDGSIFPLELKIEETKRDKGNIRVFTGAIRDVTKRRKAEEKQTELYEQLKTAKKELENANVELSEKIEKLEMFQKITMGREQRIIQLKEKVKEVEGKLEG